MLKGEQDCSPTFIKYKLQSVKIIITAGTFSSLSLNQAFSCVEVKFIRMMLSQAQKTQNTYTKDCNLGVHFYFTAIRKSLYSFSSYIHTHNLTPMAVRMGTWQIHLMLPALNSQHLQIIQIQTRGLGQRRRKYFSAKTDAEVKLQKLKIDGRQQQEWCLHLHTD